MSSCPILNSRPLNVTTRGGPVDYINMFYVKSLQVQNFLFPEPTEIHCHVI